MRILVVEDEVKLAEAIKIWLERQGYAVDFLLDGEAAQHRIELLRNEYDLIILDLMLPKKDGFEVCRAVREKKITTPILVLTARSSTDDKINALDLGVDDYLVKPFSFDELVARIRALARRPEGTMMLTLKIGNLILNTSTRRVTCKDVELSLTLKEYSLLEYLMRHPGEVLDREKILGNVWDFNFDSFSNVIDVHIKNLRKKLRNVHSGNTLETVRGIGYRLVG